MHPPPTGQQQVAAEIARLVGEIAHHNRLYHELDTPEISDGEYDALVRRYDALIKRHPELAPNHSPRERVGGAPKREFTKVRHAVPMLSLANAFSEDDIGKFDRRIRKLLGLGEEPLRYAVDTKVDGLSCSLLYRQGQLICAATRGDGAEGEDVTANIAHVGDVPQQLHAPYPEWVEVRGEVYITNADFAKLNHEQLAQGERPFSTPRNAAAGSLRQLDASKTAGRRLSFFAYQIARHSEDISFTRQSEIWQQLEAWGFEHNRPCAVIESLERLQQHYLFNLSTRAQLPYEIDGLVYKLEDLALQKKLGNAGRTPRWAIAHKFPANLVETVITDITHGVGMSGMVVPVAKLTPVKIGGVLVTSVTLHNPALVEKLDLRVGDTVFLERAGDVIPHILGVVKEKRPKVGAIPYMAPYHCPSCHCELVIEDTSRRCSNPRCYARTVAQLEHFASKDALDLTGIGPGLIRLLVGSDAIDTAVDFFRFAQFKDSDIAAVGPKSYAKICRMLAKRRAGVALHRVIYGLGIRHVGRSTARILAQHWGSLQAMLATPPERLVEELVGLPDIGEITATSIATYLNDADNRQLIESLARILVTTVSEAGRLAGKTVVFTGSFPGTSRALLRDAALHHGARVSDSVSLNTDYLIVGDNAGSKLKKAQALNIPVLDEAQWLTLIGES